MARTATVRANDDKDDLDVELVTADDPTFNVMIVGDPGAGKTTLAATAQDHPQMSNVLFANVEGGMLSIAGRGDIHKRDIRSTKALAELGWQIANGRFPSVRTVVIDNITELQTINLEEIVTDAIKAGRNMVKGRQRTVDDVWQEDYGRSTVQLKRLFRMFRDLPINVIFVAHARRIYPRVPEGTDLTKIDPIMILPSLTQKLMESTMGYMDFVWTLEQDTDAVDENNKPVSPAPRFLVTQSTGMYRCKTRGPRFAEAIGTVVDDPSLPALYDLFVRTELGGSATSTKPRKR